MPKLQAARVTQCGLDFAVVLVDPKLFLNSSGLMPTYLLKYFPKNEALGKFSE